MKIKEAFHSVRMKLFLTLTVVVVIIIAVLILLNNVVLETYYLHSKRNSLLDVYKNINEVYEEKEKNEDLDLELEFEKIALNHNFDMIIISKEGISVFSSNKNFLNTLGEINEMERYLCEQKKYIVSRFEFVYQTIIGS